MFEATKDFFADALNHSLEDPRMLDIMLTLIHDPDQSELGKAVHDFSNLTPKQRNYITCVLLERSQDSQGWANLWDELEAGAFE